MYKLFMFKVRFALAMLISTLVPTLIMEVPVIKYLILI